MNNANPIYHVEGEDGSFLKIFESGMQFSPPVYVQRYRKVVELVEGLGPDNIGKVADLGCATMKLFPYLRSVKGIEHIVFVDKEKTLLKEYSWSVMPLAADHLVPRSLPLQVSVVEGDVKHWDSLLANTQVVTMVELIEHMPESDLPYLVENVFGNIQPILVIVTTPNADFNQYIPNMESKFRHLDHKFEWTSRQFQKWCESILENYPGYTVSFTGCGLGPNNIYCTQVATFSQVFPWKCQQRVHKEPSQEKMPSLYNIICNIVYPVDQRSDQQKAQDEIINRINEIQRMVKKYGIYGTFVLPVEREPCPNLWTSMVREEGRWWEKDRSLKSGDVKSQENSKPEGFTENLEECGRDCALGLENLSLSPNIEVHDEDVYIHEKDLREKILLKSWVSTLGCSLRSFLESEGFDIRDTGNEGWQLVLSMKESSPYDDMQDDHQSLLTSPETKETFQTLSKTEISEESWD
ncbi:hen1 methyltransferase [Oratosquilla oratoria]|uniref:hen1 methyltransferase n=1 Tax=Oratosquilla oratoria TaxID=337810 RepID=UPI003F75DC4C